MKQKSIIKKPLTDSILSLDNLKNVNVCLPRRVKLS